MGLHVADFSGGIVVDGSADSQKTNEVQVADAYDIGAKGTLIVTADPSDYLDLQDGAAVLWARLWALFECGGFNFSKVLAVGEGGDGTGLRAYIMNSFNREGDASPLSFASGAAFGSTAVATPIVPVMPAGAVVTGADFAGVFPVLTGAVPIRARVYFVNIGAREGVGPNRALGLYVLITTPPATAPVPFQIADFDSLLTGPRGLIGIPVALGGEGGASIFQGRQLYFRGIIAYNNFLFGWGFDASDERITAITNITQANPANVTAAAHGYNTGDTVLIKGVGGMTQVNGQYFTITVTGVNNFTLGVDSTAYGAYTANGRAIVGNGDGPARVMFCNLGQPTKFGNDNQALAGTNRQYTDSDAVVLGDAGEIIRGGIVYRGKLILGTNKGLHYIAGYGRDTFISDGATPIMRSYNVVGPKAMIEGPDKMLYGVSDQGLWAFDGEGIPLPLFQQLRDYKQRSNGYWDQIWTENTAVLAGSFVNGRIYTITSIGTTDFTLVGAASNTLGLQFTASGAGAGTGTATPAANSYPGQTNQDLVWMAVDWERQQVVIGIPWCSIANGYGYGADTIVLKYHVQTGGFTRQQFSGEQYTAAGYFRAIAQQAATRFLGISTSGGFAGPPNKMVQRYSYKATNNAAPALPQLPPAVRFGPYVPFGSDGEGEVTRLYLTMSWDPLGTANALNTPNLVISNITQANPAVVTTATPHGFISGQKIDIHGVTCAMRQIVGGPYTIVVTGPTTFSLTGINSIAFSAFGGAAYVTLPLIFSCTLKIDEQIVSSFGAGVTTTFNISLRCVPPPSPSEGDLWLDMSEEDPNLGNRTAGTNTLALGGYLIRLRRDNAPVTITGATKANPCVVTAPGHNLSTGQRVSIRNVVGMTQLNNDAGAGPYTKDYTIVVVDADHFSLVGIDSSAFGVYASGGTVCLAWLLIPGMGGTGNRASFPIPVTRRPGTRFTIDLNATTLARRYQIEGFGMNPGDGDSDV